MANSLVVAQIGEDERSFFTPGLLQGFTVPLRRRVRQRASERRQIYHTYFRAGINLTVRPHAGSGSTADLTPVSISAKLHTE